MEHTQNTSLLEVVIQLIYLAATMLFIFGLKGMNTAKTARNGMIMAAMGMAAAMLGAMLDPRVHQYGGIAAGLIVGSIIGVIMAVYTPMTNMPQRTALSHAFGALAATLVGLAEFYEHAADLSVVQRVAISIEVMLGSLTVTGSLIAFGKLQEWIKGSHSLPAQNVISIGLMLALAGLTGYVIYDPTAAWAFYTVIGLGLVLGVLIVMPIGAADMPVVIALLNSFAGLAGSATGFALQNNILIVAGALDGLSGLILAVLMSKAMNRPLTNVIFSKIEASTGASADDVYAGKIKSSTPEELAMLLETATRVVIVPGYGMAVSQAQHAVRDLYKILDKRGINVEFAIHPVAGRMPGHMNVLLAEADIPYERLIEMDAINPSFDSVDVAIVIGANDVVNPDARDPKSPIAGMPILDVDKARMVAVIKRSLAPGFAGIPNPLFALDNTLMCFGDGNKFLQELNAALKDQH